MKREFLAFLSTCALIMPMIASCGNLGAKENRLVVGTTDRLVYSSEAPYPLDPAAAYDVGAWNVMRNAFQTLLRTTQAGAAPVPDAAEECHFTGRNNTVFSCTLRKGLQFSDGDRITAENVKYSIERVLRIQHDGGPFGLLTNVSAVVAEDERRVAFHLKRPDATFPYKLSTPTASIVSDKHYPYNDLRRGFSVDGSGPYALEVHSEGDSGKSITFTRNSSYKGALNVLNSGVELRIFESAEEMSKALKTAEIDAVIRTMTPAQVHDLQWVRDDSIELYESPSLEIRYLVFNPEHPAVSRKSIRQAIAQVIDRHELIAEAYPDAAHLLYSIVPAYMVGHVNSFFSQYGEPDIEKAAELLAADGVTTPVQLTLNYTTDHYGPGTELEFQEIQRQLNASGLFDVDIKGAEWSRYGSERLDGQYAVYGLGWFPDFPDADGFLSPLLGEGNQFNLKPGRYIEDELLPREQKQTDRADAVKDLKRIQDVVAEEVWFLPLWQGVQYAAAQDYVTGVERAVNASSDLQLWELRRGMAAD